MRSTLITRWSLESVTYPSHLPFSDMRRGKAKTFYDRPPAHFQRISAPDCEQLFTRLPHLKPAANVLLAVSSTSWTADEDFSLLLDALSTYERTAKRKVCIIITGKGPLRRDFERDLTQRTEREKWQWVEVRLAWLEAADYPLLLGEPFEGRDARI
jgi:beta-1,4-mannosyltransferase